MARKLKKVLDSQLETDLETQEALRELSKFFTENTLRNRRNLRGEIERQSLNNHLEFLNRFEKVKVSLKTKPTEIISTVCIGDLEKLYLIW